jgi:hypothetical protein
MLGKSLTCAELAEVGFTLYFFLPDGQKKDAAATK